MFYSNELFRYELLLSVHEHVFTVESAADVKPKLNLVFRFPCRGLFTEPISKWESVDASVGRVKPATEILFQEPLVTAEAETLQKIMFEHLRHPRRRPFYSLSLEPAV